MLILIPAVSLTGDESESLRENSALRLPRDRAVSDSSQSGKSSKPEGGGRGIGKLLREGAFRLTSSVLKGKRTPFEGDK